MFFYELDHHLLDKYIMEPKYDEVFVIHHGFRFARQEVLYYVKDKEVIDIGAFLGDSALLLSNYTNKKIHSFEVSPKHCEVMKNNLIKNHIEDRVEIHNMGLGDEQTTMYLSRNEVYSGQSVSNHGSVPVPMDTVDNIVKKFNLNPGIIKADIEGYELKMLYGARETIKKYRPIITISLYHNYDGMFRIPDYVKSFGNYKFGLRACSQGHGHFGELIMFAYPAEIGNFESFDNNFVPHNQ